MVQLAKYNLVITDRVQYHLAHLWHLACNTFQFNSDELESLCNLEEYFGRALNLSNDVTDTWCDSAILNLKDDPLVAL